MSQLNGSVFTDPRIDKVISWAGTAIATIAFSISAWFFQGLDHSIKELQSSVNELNRDITGISRNGQTLVDHENRIRYIEKEISIRGSIIDLLIKKIDGLEKGSR
jgi:uncharacterized protein YoxC